MQSNSKYLEKSLKGQWISLARDWLEDHAPCSMKDYLSQVAPLMPTHIIRGGTRARQVALAKEAISMLCVEVDNGIIGTPKPRIKTGKSIKGYTDLIREAAGRGEVIEPRRIEWAGKNANKLCNILLMRGELIRVAPGKYAKSNS